MYCSFFALAAVAAAFPHPFPNTPSDEALFVRQAPSQCDTPGAVVCSGPQQFGICNVDNTVVFQSVAAGTACTCDSSGACAIAASVAGAAGSNGALPSSSPSFVQSPSPTAYTTTNMSSGPAPNPTSSGSDSSPISGPAFNTISTPAPPPASNEASPPPPSSESSSSKTEKQPNSSATPDKTGSTPAPPVPTPTGGYQVYKGDGSAQQGWPDQSQWLPFDELWKGYLPMIGKNCENLYTPVRDNTDEETANLQKALLSESSKGGVPSNFALALVMQESLGCVAVATTDNGVTNPGLYQCHDGQASCFNKSDCSASEIEDMVHEGIFGTVSGDGFQQLAAQQVKAGYSGAQEWYRVARAYNSGSIAASNDLNDGVGSTNCYVMDVANRVTGQWFTGNDMCTL